MNKSQSLAALHQSAKSSFERVQSAIRDERLQCLQDRRFYSIAGAQWEGRLGEQFENKPRLEVNKIHLAVIRIINEYRNNRITVNFVSKDGNTDNDDLANTCTSLYRADEQDSVAEEAYDNAFEEAVGGGFGAWRLKSEYEDDESEDDDRQRIRIEPIFDADSCVFFSLDAKRQDKSDAKECWVLTGITRDSYREKWGDDPARWSKSINQSEFDWLTPDVVYVAEYYKVEDASDTIKVYRGLDDKEQKHKLSEIDEEKESELKATGFTLIREKKIKTKRIHKYFMSGNKILEDCGIIAGKNIPIVPVYGKRWVVDGVERCMGHVRLPKDTQRLKNMQISKLAELSALSSVEKPIFTPQQIQGHGLMWANDNIEENAYLLINQITDINGNPSAIGPAAYTRAPQIPPALAGLLQITEQDMQDVLGNQQAGEQLQPNISGKAMELIQGKLDMQTFIYISNFAKAIRRSGEIWLSMAKEVLVEPKRKMKGVSASGKAETIELYKPMMSKDGEMGFENDLSLANFDPSVDVGPSSASKKQSTVRNLTGMMQITQDPETNQVLGAMAMMNMEGEGVKDVNDFFRKKLIRIGAIKPTDEELAELEKEKQNQPPDPNTQFLQASAEQAQAEAVKARADVVLTMEKAQETKAKTMKTLADIEINETEQARSLADTLLKSYGETTQPLNSSEQGVRYV